jgi:hypothetical protein
MKPATFSMIEKSGGDLSRKVGMGRLPSITGVGSSDDRKRFIDAVGAAMQAQAYVLPNVETTRWHFDGPLSDNNVQATFGASIDPLSSSRNNPPAGANSVETTMASPGQFQTWTLIFAIGWHVEPEPLTFEAKGNSWSVPTTSSKQPVSPDDFSTADQNTTTGTLGLTGTQTLVPAVMEWGWWAEKAFFHMSRAYNLVWQWGQSTTIVNDSLRFTAYTPTSGQEGAASSSEVDVNPFARYMNNYYVNTLASPSIFVPLDRTRIGNMILSSTAGLSVYRPTRAYETVGATYGGMGLRNQLRGNSEFRKLAVPFLLKPGVPIGLRADVKNSDDQLLMQQWLSASQLLNGAVPGDYTAFANLASGAGVTGTAVIGAEPSLDNPVLPQGITTITDRVVYKGGGWKITVALKGFELTDDQAQMVQAGGSGFLGQLQSATGCCCPSL